MTNPGSITLITGPMFSGKTTELLRNIRVFKIADKKCLLIKSEKDKRYSDNEICTHDMVSDKAISASVLFDAFNEDRDSFLSMDVIGIDEGQFFPDIVEFSEEMANRGKTVIVSALNGNYKREPFDVITRMFSIAENFVKLTAVCDYCKNTAFYSKRIVENENNEFIGAKESYKAACRTCFFY